VLRSILEARGTNRTTDLSRGTLPISDGGHIKCPVRAVPAIQIIPFLGQNYSCDLYFTDKAVISAHAPASITPPSTANGRLRVAYTQLNTTRKENVVAQESMFIPVFFSCMSRIWGIRRKPKTRLQMRITVSCHILVIISCCHKRGFISRLWA
jgi:hypothetical protein